MDAKTLLTLTQQAVKAATSIKNPNEMEQAITEGIIALRKITKYVSNYDIEGQHYCPECGRKGITFEVAAKSGSYLGKVINDSVRLLEFHKGNADQRTENTGSMGDLIQKLTTEQLNTVMNWVDENEALQ